jgi:Fe-S protein assembly co-chaperone HscB
MNCPHCEIEIPNGEFCPKCGKILPPQERSHYNVLGFSEEILSVDLPVLEKRLFELNKKFHPDRFANKTPLEMQFAHDHSSAVNNAYRILKDPVSRAKYVVEKNLGSIEEKSAHVPAEMAEFFFEIHDVLDTIKDSDGHPSESDLAQVKTAEKQLNAKLKELDDHLMEKFYAYDAEPDKKHLQLIKDILSERSYIKSFLRQIDNVLYGGESEL